MYSLNSPFENMSGLTLSHMGSNPTYFTWGAICPFLLKTHRNHAGRLKFCVIINESVSKDYIARKLTNKFGFIWLPSSFHASNRLVDTVTLNLFIDVFDTDLRESHQLFRTFRVGRPLISFANILPKQKR